MFGGGKNLTSILNPDSGINRRVEHEQRLFHRPNGRVEGGSSNIFEEVPPDRELAPGQRHRRRAVFADCVEIVVEVVQYVFWIMGCANSDNRFCGSDLRGRLQHCCAAKRVADDHVGGHVDAFQMRSRSNQIIDIGGEIRVGKFAPRMAQTGEIEAQRRNPQRGERLGNAACGGNVF